MNILVITPISHIKGVEAKLNSLGNVAYFDDPLYADILPLISEYDVIFTNPNKSKIFIGKDLIDQAKKIQIICTASTGTNHIDVDYARKKNIKILSLTKEIDTINKISSTAEHAFALTLSSLRNIVPACKHVLENKWNYEKFIGRQFSELVVGVIGYGRLGTMYSKYSSSMGAKVLVYDPYKKVLDGNVSQVESLDEIFSDSNIISIHVHHNIETNKMLNEKCFNKMKSDVLLINTSRGEVFDEIDLVNFLKNNNDSKVAVDVISDEIKGNESSALRAYSKFSNQVLITPHIGGMTQEAQEIAYNHAALMLERYIKLKIGN